MSSEDGNVDESHYLLGVDEKSDEGDGPISAEGISFEIQVDCAGGRDRGKEGLQFRHGRDERWGQRSGDIERIMLRE